MADYISRDKTVSQIFDKVWTKTDEDGYIWVLRRDVIHTLEDIPSADVVEVVRCRDCKHYKESKLLGPTKFCYFYQIGTGLNTADDDFCSKGEKREGTK